jgi:pimeloyl-ACP methyl ester carboxylesterase
LAEKILAHRIITASAAAEPAHWTYFLHGVFGAGRNWATIARRAVEARPDWGAVLVDLRAHGDSRGFPPPHTLGAAARDVMNLAAATEKPPTAIVAHSLGGKVALLYTREHPDSELKQVWVVDSTPAVREPGGSAWDMLRILRRLPGPFASRAEAVAALEKEGAAHAVAEWISTNLESTDQGYRWRFDLDAIESLMQDFFRTDLWDVVESPPDGVSIHFIKAEQSSVLSDDACARIERAGKDNGRVFLHRLEGGHWVNADNPEGVLRLLLQERGTSA